MSEKEVIDKLNALIEFFDNYNKMLSFMEENIERGLDAKILSVLFIEKGLKGNIYKTVKMALESAKNNAAKNDLIYVGGSTFIVAEII